MFSFVSFVTFLCCSSLIYANQISPETKAKYLGCFEDKEVRDLSHLWADVETVTVELCVDFCTGKGYPFAGVQNGMQCFCGNFLSYQKLAESECDYSCNGDPDQTCGGYMTNSIYKTGKSEIKKPKPANYLGCFKDSDVRDLGLNHEMEHLTIGSCVDYCTSLGYPFAGVQHETQCFCGNFFGRYGKVDDKQCDNNCNGDSTELCGGYERNSVFRTKASNTKKPFTSNYLGCYEDREEDEGADLMDQNQIDALTIEKCISTCKTDGYKYAGVQAGTKCFCDDTYGRYEKRDNNECDFNCAGDFTQFCGGYYRNSIYRV